MTLKVMSYGLSIRGMLRIKCHRTIKRVKPCQTKANEIKQRS